MPDIDPFDLDDEEPKDKVAKQELSNAEAARLRKELKAAEKDRAELEELRSFKAEQEKATRQNAVAAAFSELGLNPKHAKFYGGEGEVTTDAIKAWAVAEDFLQPGDDAPTPPPAEPGGFTPTVIEGGSPPASKVWTQEEFEQELRRDPEKAFRAYQAGRVKLDSLPDIGGQSVRRL